MSIFDLSYPLAKKAKKGYFSSIFEHYIARQGTNIESRNEGHNFNSADYRGSLTCLKQ